ncbi:hypothetical protein CLV84_3571 [Neolewinella xylanilytica]|uniref:Outer membrane protein beta-barrel domain-containing protein n=1 Tax=Neolewinella xylanilytica TaxID=1514080 RepID=A0A2S6I646_9BACT|nr:hypothetical protein [Neolewinella xylanilytica]PPK86636.1 hypothetical protein CLV84_3571 [Neolewinella xylanilytica]
MKQLFTFSLLFATVLLSAQNTSPILAYHAQTVVPAYHAAGADDEGTHRFSLRRERTLLGDLDLSGAWGGPTYNYSSTGQDWALVRGGFGGLEFSETVFLGYGGWSARESFTTDDADDNVDAPEYDFRHGGFIIAVSPGADNVIHPRFTAIVGPGRIDVEGVRDRMLIGQLMGGVELNLFQWFRLGIEGGYRFASGVDSEKVTAADVSGAVVQIEARFGWSW